MNALQAFPSTVSEGPEDEIMLSDVDHHKVHKRNSDTKLIPESQSGLPKISDACTTACHICHGTRSLFSSHVHHKLAMLEIRKQCIPQARCDMQGMQAGCHRQHMPYLKLTCTMVGFA